MSEARIEPNVKYPFSEPFRTQFELLLQGRNPTPPAEMDTADLFKRKAMEKKAKTDTRPPSLPQLQLLKNLGHVGVPPNTMTEASLMISRLKG